MKKTCWRELGLGLRDRLGLGLAFKLRWCSEGAEFKLNCFAIGIDARQVLINDCDASALAAGLITYTNSYVIAIRQ